MIEIAVAGTADLDWIAGIEIRNYGSMRAVEIPEDIVEGLRA